ARAVRQPVASDDDIENAFDAITYQKGGAVLAMLESWIGRERFGRGLTRYLERNRWTSVTTDAFVAAVSAEAGRDLAPLMRSLLDRPGLPLVEAAPRCEPGGARVELRQTRYLPLGSAGDRDLVWPLPVCVRVPDRAGSTRVEASGDARVGGFTPPERAA